MRLLHMNRKAFTMIELVFAIVVIGILASLAMPRIERDLVNEASTNILADIRYTQHMALIDNKHQAMRTNPHRWQQRWWKIMFGTCTGTDRFYMVGSDDSTGGNGNFSRAEAANDPSNGLPMFWINTVDCPTGSDGTVSDRIFITDKYGITSVSFEDVVAPTSNSARSCTGIQHIGFDYLGRPHQGFGPSNQPNYASYLSQDCDITFTMSTDADGDGSNDTFTIRITAETGHAFIVNQLDS